MHSIRRHHRNARPGLLSLDLSGMPAESSGLYFPLVNQEVAGKVMGPQRREGRRLNARDIAFIP
jgi:hypothetical protein